MFARFNENPAMTLQDIKETKRYGQTDGRMDARTHGHTDARTDGQRENSIPPTNKVCGGYNDTVVKRLYCMAIIHNGLFKYIGNWAQWARFACALSLWGHLKSIHFGACAKEKKGMSCQIPASVPKNPHAQSRFCICR